MYRSSHAPAHARPKSPRCRRRCKTELRGWPAAASRRSDSSINRYSPGSPELSVVAVVGLGYVGLPLAVQFGKRYPTIGFDLSERKIEAYRRFVDPTGEMSESELRAAGVHRASSIKVAEASKVIENTQRDLNIALINELALSFHKIGIDTTEVLEAAGTKWNFLNFRPGLVGGHCIGVDPYYLTHKADMLGYHPQVILAGRRINDGMGKYVADQTVKLMIQAGSSVKGAAVNVLGLTFKENCADLRNSRVIDVIRELTAFGACVHVHDALPIRPRRCASTG